MSEDAAAKRRAKQTVNNLVLALLASLGVMLALVLVVPRDDSNRIQSVDYKAIAAEAQASSGQQIIAPELPAGWWSNSARWTAKPADGVQNWYSGFVGPKNQYIGLTQAFGINPTWLAFQLKNSAKTGTQAVGDKTWDVYEALERGEDGQRERARGARAALERRGAREPRDGQRVARARDNHGVREELREVAREGGDARVQQRVGDGAEVVDLCGEGVGHARSYA
jgi:hypothetical protein